MNKCPKRVTKQIKNAQPNETEAENRKKEQSGLNKTNYLRVTIINEYAHKNEIAPSISTEYYYEC